MPEIDLSEDNWERLKIWATPFEDTPNDAIRKLLDFADHHMTRDEKVLSVERESDPEEPQLLADSNEVHDLNCVTENRFGRRSVVSRLPRGQKIPNEDYYEPILLTLLELGGRARASAVLNGVEKRMKHKFTEVDYHERPSGGEIRWRLTAQWERNTMVHQLGVLRNDSPHGVWELSEAGIAEARRLSTLQH